MKFRYFEFYYHLRDSELTDPKFVEINEKDLFDKKKLYGRLVN